MTKRLHILFWIALAIPTLTLILLLVGYATTTYVMDAAVNQAKAFALLMVLGAGPICALYAAAAFSRRPWFFWVAAGVSLLLAISHPFITWYGGGLAMLGAGICAWTVAFVGIGISGGIRLVRTLTNPTRA